MRSEQITLFCVLWLCVFFAFKIIELSWVMGIVLSVFFLQFGWRNWQLWAHNNHFQKKPNEILPHFTLFSICMILHNYIGQNSCYIIVCITLWLKHKQIFKLRLFETDTRVTHIINHMCLSSFFFCRPNVCTERKEEISDWNSPASSTEKEEEGEVRGESTSISGGFHFSFNTCVEKANKRTCKTV